MDTCSIFLSEVSLDSLRLLSFCHDIDIIDLWAGAIRTFIFDQTDIHLVSARIIESILLVQTFCQFLTDGVTHDRPILTIGGSLKAHLLKIATGCADERDDIERSLELLNAHDGSIILISIVLIELDVVLCDERIDINGCGWVVVTGVAYILTRLGVLPDERLTLRGKHPVKTRRISREDLCLTLRIDRYFYTVSILCGTDRILCGVILTDRASTP